MGKKTNLKTYQGTTGKAIILVAVSVLVMMYVLKFLYDWCCLA